MPKAYFQWRELAVYEEDGKVLTFDAPMGVPSKTIDIYVPTAESWQKNAPEWAKNKREQVLETLRNMEKTGEIIEDPKTFIGTSTP